VSNNLNYLMVLQWETDLRFDLDFVVQIENLVIDVLGDSADVDGHDFGSSEANIFVFTNDPRATFSQVLPVLQSLNIYDELRAAYRHSAGSDFTVLHPATLHSFKVA
jgi:hypothetical protein